MTSESIPSAAADLSGHLLRAHRVAILTGAGISAESGIPTFRSGTSALWRDRKPEDLATPEAFARNPGLVTDWYLMRLRTVLDALPNPGHLALAELERRFAARGAAFTVLTQNVDGLHRAGGSSDVVELHGSIRRWRCIGCARERQLTADFVRSQSERGGPIECDCGALMRPGVVWFGEALPADAWTKADAAASEADVFIVAGTSAAVYPAAGLVAIAKRAGAFVVEVNPEMTEASGLCDLVVRASSGEFLPLLL
jgi:NAD-dependent protein deacetylase/lipoamidase